MSDAAKFGMLAAGLGGLAYVFLSGGDTATPDSQYTDCVSGVCAEQQQNVQNTGKENEAATTNYTGFLNLRAPFGKPGQPVAPAPPDAGDSESTVPTGTPLDPTGGGPVATKPTQVDLVEQTGTLAAALWLQSHDDDYVKKQMITNYNNCVDHQSGWERFWTGNRQNGCAEGITDIQTQYMEIYYKNLGDALESGEPLYSNGKQQKDAGLAAPVWGAVIAAVNGKWQTVPDPSQCNNKSTYPYGCSIYGGSWAAPGHDWGFSAENYDTKLYNQYIHEVPLIAVALDSNKSPSDIWNAVNKCGKDDTCRLNVLNNSMTYQPTITYHDWLQKTGQDIASSAHIGYSEQWDKAALAQSFLTNPTAFAPGARFNVDYRALDKGNLTSDAWNTDLPPEQQDSNDTAGIIYKHNPDGVPYAVNKYQFYGSVGGVPWKTYTDANSNTTYGFTDSGYKYGWGV